MKLKIHRDVKRLIEELIRNGWYVNNINNHVKIYSPDGVLRTVAGSSLSDARGIINIRLDIRRARMAYDRDTKKNFPLEKS